MFSCTAAAQLCAFFALKEGGGINIVKLMKLLYLAERESMQPLMTRRFSAIIMFP